MSEFFGCLRPPKVVVDGVLSHCLTKATPNPGLSRSLLRVGVHALGRYLPKTDVTIAPPAGAMAVKSRPPGLLARAGHPQACNYSLLDSLDG